MCRIIAVRGKKWRATYQGTGVVFVIAAPFFGVSDLNEVLRYQSNFLSVLVFSVGRIGGKHPLSPILEMTRDRALGRKVPQRCLHLSQSEYGEYLAGNSPRLHTVLAPADIGIAPPVFPASKVEPSEPTAVKLRLGFALHLHAAEELHELIFGVAIQRFVDGSSGFVQSHECKIRGVEQVRVGGTVGLNERGFRRAIRLVYVFFP